MQWCFKHSPLRGVSPLVAGLLKVDAVQQQLAAPNAMSLARATAFCGPQFLACTASPNCHLVTKWPLIQL